MPFISECLSGTSNILPNHLYTYSRNHIGEICYRTNWKHIAKALVTTINILNLKVTPLNYHYIYSVSSLTFPWGFSCNPALWLGYKYRILWYWGKKLAATLAKTCAWSLKNYGEVMTRQIFRWKQIFCFSFQKEKRGSKLLLILGENSRWSHWKTALSTF